MAIVKMRENGAPYEYGALQVTQLLALSTDKTSCAGLVLRGENRPTINLISTARYTCIGGQGYVKIDDRIVPLCSGVSFDVPAGTPFQDWSLGDSELLLISEYSPPFDRMQVQYLEE